MMTTTTSWIVVLCVVWLVLGSGSTSSNTLRSPLFGRRGRYRSSFVSSPSLSYSVSDRFKPTLHSSPPNPPLLLLLQLAGIVHEGSRPLFRQDPRIRSSRFALRSGLRMDEPLPPPHTPGRPTTPQLPVLLPVVDDGKMDVVSKLLKDRILLLGNQVTDEVSNALVAQLLFLANSDPTADIHLYINSPGGSVTAGLALFDTMKYVPCDVETVCFGLAASMGAFLLAAGTKGKRRALPNSRIMIHQPLGGAQGQASDIEIQAKEILFTRNLLNAYMADFTGQEMTKIEEDSDRDFFMTPQEAKDYGLLDEVIRTKASHVKIPNMPTLGV